MGLGGVVTAGKSVGWTPIISGRISDGRAAGVGLSAGDGVAVGMGVLKLGKGNKNGALLGTSMT